MKPGIDYIGVGVGPVLKNSEGKYFLAQRGQNVRNEKGKWEFPGGAVKFGDTLEIALKRELKEEFDIEVEIIGKPDIYDHLIPEENQHWVAVSFLTKIKSGTPRILEPEKCSQIGWFSLKEINNLNLTINSRDIANDLIKNM